MVWSKLDDRFHSHPKIAALEPQLLLKAVGLYALALSWCGEHLTDGLITQGQVRRLAGGDRDLIKVVELLCTPPTGYEYGLWERVEGGYIVHDFTKYNPAKEKALALSATRSEAGRRGGLVRQHGKEASNGLGKSSSKSSSNCLGKTEANFNPEPEPEPEPPDNPSGVVAERPKRERKRIGIDEARQMVESFNARCPSLPQVIRVSDTRRANLYQLHKEVGSVEAVDAFFDRVEASPWLTGANDRGWKATFDWVLKPTNRDRILEGVYDKLTAPTRSELNVARALRDIQDLEEAGL